MKVRHNDRLKRSVSVIGFGGWQLGNNEQWGDMSFDEGKNLVRDAFAMGITFFDTAPNYSYGKSEEIIGSATKDFREQVFINTKFGHTADGKTNFSVTEIEESIRKSLIRLNTNYIDTVMLHNPPVEVLEGKTSHEHTFKRLIEEGVIHGYGVSIETKEELELTLNNLDVDTIEIRFNVIHQEVTELFDKVKEKGIMLVVKVPLDSGWLTGKYDKDTVFEGVRSRFSRQAIQDRAVLLDDIKDILGEDPIVPSSLAFILSFDAVTTVIPGVKSYGQLKENVAASKFELDDQKRIDLIRLYEEKIKKMNLPM